MGAGPSTLGRFTRTLGGRGSGDRQRGTCLFCLWPVLGKKAVRVGVWESLGEALIGLNRGKESQQKEQKQHVSLETFAAAKALLLTLASTLKYVGAMMTLIMQRGHFDIR